MVVHSLVLSDVSGPLTKGDVVQIINTTVFYRIRLLGFET